MSKAYQAKPSMTSRSGWGATSASCTLPSLAKSSVTRLIVHHCASSNTSVTNRTENQHQKWLQDYFKSIDYCDIAYHYNIGKNGTILEGNPSNRVGYHAGSYNTSSLGVSVHGNYESRTFSATQEARLVNLLAWLCYDFNIEPSRIVGHRDVSSTLCPGANIYSRLPAIRTAVYTKLYPNGPQPTGMEQPLEDPIEEI